MARTQKFPLKVIHLFQSCHMIPSLCRVTATTDSLSSLLNVTANLANAFLDSGIKVLIIYQNMQHANILYNPFKAELLLMHFWVISIENSELCLLNQI